MASRVVLEGMDEFKRALRNLPSELAQEAGDIVMDAAQAAKNDIVSAYPAVTGNLKGHVRVTKESTPFGAVATVKSTASHAHLYEYGTQTRQTSLGYNRGEMPAKPTFVPTVVRRRRAMHQALVGLLRKAGFQVTGDAG